MPPPGACPTCGRPLDEHDRHVRFSLPDPVLDLPERDATPGTWMSHADARQSVMMQVPGAGPFLRALLRVTLTGGHTVTFGVWLSVHPDDLQRAFRVWWEPEYAALELDGRLANSLPVWGLLGASVRARVRDPDHTPYCESSPDPGLHRVLTEEWPHEALLDVLG